MADLLALATFMDDMLSFGGPAQRASNLACDAALAIVEDLTQVTPADTGGAISNWQITLDDPAEEVRPAFVPSPKGREVKGKWTHKVPPSETREANAPSVVAELNSILLQKRPGEPIFIANNAEYIQRLNEGYSEQAPAAFVERAIIVGEQVVARRA